MKNSQEITKWLNRAEGNLERARTGKLNDKTYYEDLCFDCQQAESLSLYAAQTRYPGDYEPLTDEDYKEALMLAEYVYSWVGEKIGLL